MIFTVLKQLFISVSLCCLVACATSEERADAVANEPDQSREDCIQQSSIRGYSVLDEQNLIVSGSGRRKYHVVLMRRAYGLRNSWGIAFDAPSSRVCSRFSEVVFKSDFGDRTESIRISKIWLLTPEDEETLLIKFGKKEPEIKQTPAPQEVKGADVEELDTADSE